MAGFMGGKAKRTRETCKDASDVFLDFMRAAVGG